MMGFGLRSSQARTSGRRHTRRKRSFARRSYEERRRTYVMWGIGTIALTATAVYLMFGGAIPFVGDGYQVKAVMRNASELRPESPVRIAGVEVGKVKKIERGPGTTALITMKIEESARPLHEDASLKVRPRLFLEGNFFVDLEPGSPSAPEMEDDGTIPLGRTATPVQLDQVLSTLDADGRGQLQTLLRETGDALDRGGAEALGKALDATGPALEPTATVLSSLRGLEDRDLSQTIVSVAKVTATLDERREQLAGLVDGFDRTTAALAASDDDLSATVRGLASTLREARPAVRAIRGTLPETREFAADVRPLLRRTPATLDLLRPLLAEVRPLLAQDALPTLTRSLRPPVQRLSALQPELETLLGKVTPVADCLRRQVVPTLSTPVEDGDHTTGRAPYLELLSALVGLASSSQSFDGNGHHVRYLAGFGEQLISTGKVPGFGALSGLAPLPVEAARPAPPKRKPPFQTTEACRDQQRVDLRAKTAPAVLGEAPAPGLSPRDKTLIDRVLDLLRQRGAGR